MRSRFSHPTCAQGEKDAQLAAKDEQLAEQAARIAALEAAAAGLDVPRRGSTSVPKPRVASVVVDNLADAFAPLPPGMTTMATASAAKEGGGARRSGPLFGAKKMQKHEQVRFASSSPFQPAAFRLLTSRCSFFFLCLQYMLCAFWPCFNSTPTQPPSVLSGAQVQQLA